MYKAHDMMLAKKNKVPILPPNSGPRARLIMTGLVSRKILIVSKEMKWKQESSPCEMVNPN